MGATSQAPRWTRGWEAIVDEASFPQLAELLRSPQGAAARDELERLLGHFWQERATRHRVEANARLVLPGADGVEIPVTTVDVSASGLLVTVPYGQEIDVMTASDLTVALTARSDEGPVDVSFRATLVRMAGVTEDGVRLGLRFDPAEQPSATVIETLRGAA